MQVLKQCCHQIGSSILPNDQTDLQLQSLMTGFAGSVLLPDRKADNEISIFCGRSKDTKELYYFLQNLCAMVVKCCYHNCGNTSRSKSVFSFPINDHYRLQLWIQYSGNKELSSLSHEKLIRYFICEDHFKPEDVCKNWVRSRLLHTAVPLPSEPVTPPSPVSPPIEHVKVVRILCMQCDKPINGFAFQWWCLQCGGLRCSSCALRLVHRPHFLLRSPANTTPEQIQILIAAIQKELQLEDFFNPRDTDKHVDNGASPDVDLDVIEESLREPTVKAEPPEEAEDPLAECSNNFILNPHGTPTNNCSPNDRQPNSPSHKHGLDDSLNTHDEYSSDLPLRGDTVLGPRDKYYQPSEKSLSLINPFEYQRYMQYLGLDTPLENQASQSSVLDDSIEYRPSKKSVCIDEIDYQINQTSGSIFYYKPSKKSVCLESIDRSSQTPTGLDNSEHRPKFLDFGGLNCNFSLYTYDQPNMDNIWHSASLQVAPKSPDRAPSPKPNSIELSGPCSLATDKVPNINSAIMEFYGSYTLATDRVPNTDPTGMELFGSCSFATDKFPNTDPIGMELCGSGYESDGSSVHFETLVPNDQHPSDEDIHPPCNERVRGQSSTENGENHLMNTTTPQATQMEQKNDHNKQKSVNTKGNLKNTHNRIQKPRIYATYTKKGLKNNAVQTERLKQKSVKSIEDPYYDPLKTQLPEILADSTHRNKHYTDTTEEQSKKNETQQPPIKVYSKKRTCTNTIEQRENKLNSINTIGDPKKDQNKTQEIKINTTHKKQNCKNITEPDDDNTTTQEPKIQVYSTHKKRNCTDSTELGINHKTHLSIEMNLTHKDMKCMETTKQHKDTNKIQETQIQVYSTHKPRNSKSKR